jgi:hypothetical protein
VVVLFIEGVVTCLLMITIAGRLYPGGIDWDQLEQPPKLLCDSHHYVELFNLFDNRGSAAVYPALGYLTHPLACLRIYLMLTRIMYACISGWKQIRIVKN